MRKISLFIKLPTKTFFSNEVLRSKLQKFESFEKKDNGFRFLTDNSIFFIKHKLTLQYNQEKNNIKVDIELNSIINSIIVILVFLAFFAKISIILFITLSVIFPLGYIWLNMLWVRIYLRGILGLNDENEILDTSKQAEWIKDPSKCSGCGASLSIYDYKCHECGLYCKENTNHSRFSTSINLKKLNYTLKKRN
jgi:hypothetical protein